MIIDYLGGQIDLNRADDNMSALMAETLWEHRKVAYLQEHLKPGMIFVDAGAHIGYFTLIAAKLVGEKGKVFAYEPDPQNWRRLRDNVTHNGYTWVNYPRVGLSEHAENLRLYQHPNSAFSSVERVSETSQVIPVTRLDLALQYTAIDIVKIDVEAHEAAVLRGMTGIFERFQPLTLLMDLHPELGANNHDVEAILTMYGFSLFDMRNDNAPIDHISPTLVELLAVRT